MRLLRGQGVLSNTIRSHITSPIISVIALTHRAVKLAQRPFDVRDSRPPQHRLTSLTSFQPLSVSLLTEDRLSLFRFVLCVFFPASFLLF